MEQKIKAGAIIPQFRLPDAQGRLITRQQFRGRANLLLLFLPDLGPASQRFLSLLAEVTDSWPRDQQVLAIATAAIADLPPLATSRMTLLADFEGQVRERFLYPQVAGAWFVTDRWGELYALGQIASAVEFPPPAELQGWLEFISCECTG